ncbi:hypothetical protein [Endothiovibrio diazotrophicus]
MKKLLVIALSAALLSACASRPDKISAAQVSSAGYEKMTCNEIEAEMTSNFNRTQDLNASLHEKASNDEAAMAIGMILFWPALFALEGGDGPEAAEYSRLKGEFNALEGVAVRHDCERGIELGKERREVETKMRIAREKAKAEASQW